MTRHLVCAALLGCLWVGSASAGPALTVKAAWIPEAPPSARVQAAYMELANEGSTRVVVAGASSPDFARIEIHRTVDAQGIVRMELQPAVAIEPGTTLALAPGGLHLMLIEPKRRLAAGDRVDIELRLDDGSRVGAVADVRSGAAPAADHEHHHH